jgi:hypothetical protein
MDSYIATFYAIVFGLGGLGTLLIAKWYERDKQRRADAEEFWRRLQPNLYNDGLKGHLHTDEDQLEQAPLLPEDYRDWNSKK